jgi:hypothetical protein
MKCGGMQFSGDVPRPKTNLTQAASQPSTISAQHITGAKILLLADRSHGPRLRLTHGADKNPSTQGAEGQEFLKIVTVSIIEPLIAVAQRGKTHQGGLLPDRG